MIGGSLESFIGPVHRMAAALDGQIELVCGAFSSHSGRSRQTGEALFLDPDRIYGSFEEMFQKEKSLSEDLRMDFVSVVTPNHLHFLPCKLALESGFHVLCEKPLAFSLAEAQELQRVVDKTRLIFGLTHNYTGYPMVKEAREWVKSGRIGKIRKIIAEYPQGWLAMPLETEGQKQASWRTDPAQSGISCCVGDIGTHAENLAEYITGLSIQEVCADIATFVAGRALEDDANILVRFEQGAKGAILVSQVATGEENELKIRIYGEKGGLQWLQSDPNTLTIHYPDRPKEIIRAGANYAFLSESAKAHCRLPGGHPEGYLESLANLYQNFARAVLARLENTSANPLFDFPTIHDGVRGMQFIEAVIASGKNNATWVSI